jgi:tetratricopeptide (TPR) repeat protein
VLVFEDLHWADDGLLDFIDHLVDWSSGVPLLCVCTARPELLERRQGWGGGKLNATTIALSPLSDDETQQLLANLLGRTVLPAALLQFAGGNPLYAEEYARMLTDRGLEDTVLPETVQGIIAARLDALPGEEKAALQNAAVFGKVFWSGSLTALDGEPETALQQPLHALIRKEFVRRERRSSVGRQEEYAFRHVLVQDVAYGQIPRAERAAKHRRAAEWIESVSERGDDLADLLAHHYVTALEYGADGLGDRAARALQDAADRSWELNSYSTAIRYYRAALDLLPLDDPARGEVLVGLGRTRYLAEVSGNEELREGVSILEARNPEVAAEGLVFLALLSQHDQQEKLSYLERALALVRDRPATKEKGNVLGVYASALLLAHEPARALELGREALEITTELGDVGGQAQTLLALGNLRLNAGDLDGLADMEEALELALESNSVAVKTRCYGNLADACASHLADVDRCFALQAEGRKLAEKVGTEPLRHFFAGERAVELYLRGSWDEAFALGEGLVDELAGSESPHFIEIPTRDLLAHIALGRGLTERADTESMTALERARAIGDPQCLYTAFAGRALVLLKGGRTEDARGIVEEFMTDVTDLTERTGQTYIPWVERVLVPWLCRRLGRESDLAGLLDRAPEWTHNTPWSRLIRQILSDELVGAADTAETLLPPHAAFLRVEAARELVAKGRRADADVQLGRALAFYRRAGADDYIREAEELRAKTA